MLSKFIKSFYFAFQGIIYALKSQRNMKIHFTILTCVIIAGIWLKLNKLEWCVIFIVAGMVIVAEMINTSIEAVVDLNTQEFAPLAKIAKDVAAGAVLIASLISIIIGLLIFFPKILLLF